MSLSTSLQNLRTKAAGSACRVSAWFWALPAGVWVWSARLAWAGTLFFLLVLATVQWIFVSRLHHYQDDIEAHASALLGQTVRIGHLQGHWRGLNPGIVLDGLHLVDGDGKPSLSLQQVAVFLSWKSLVHGQPVVDLLLIDSPVLHIRRSPEGKIRIAGFGAEGETDPEVMARLLSLRQLRIQRAEIIWEDQLRGAPPLALREVNFGLDNIRYLHLVHRFGFSALPPNHLASRLDVRGEWEGDIESLLSGHLFAELISADLAAWQPWLDAPKMLASGRGGVRVWAERLQEKPTATLDMGLADVRFKPGQAIPDVDIDRLQGRFLVSGQLNPAASNSSAEQKPMFDGFELKAQSFNAQSISLYWPDFFPAGPVKLDTIGAQFGLKGEKDGWGVTIDRLDFANADAAGQLKGNYTHTLDGPRLMDLQGDISRAEGAAVWRYLPVLIGAETRQWLRDSLLAGVGSEGKLVLRGDLRKFPFHTPEEGIFQIYAKVQDAVLAFAKSWPTLQNIQGDIRFEQLGMRIAAREARFAGGGFSNVKLGPAEATMPDLETLDEQLHIKGTAQGQSAEFLNFIERSPVGGFINHATRDMRAQGEGKLELAVDLPVRRLKDTHVRGTYHVQHNEVAPLAVLPPIQQVSGKIVFTEQSVHIPSLQGMWLGAPAHFQGGGRQALNFSAKGSFNPKDYRATLPVDHPLQPFLTGLSGSTSWQADIRVPQGKGLSWLVSTDLQGLSSSLPGPLNKSATRRVATVLAVTPLNTGAKMPTREQWALRSEGVANGVLHFRTTPEASQFERGVLALGSAIPKLPDSGLSLAIKWPEFKADEWLRLRPEDKPEKPQGGMAGIFPAPSQFSLETDRLLAMGRQIDRVAIQGTAVDTGWQLSVNAQDLVGNVLWRPEGRGSVRADLKHLHLAKASAEKMGDEWSSMGNSSGSKTLPALDIRVADFSLGDSHLGRLELRAENEGYRWRLPHILLSSAEGKFTADGVWEMARGSGKSAVADNTQLAFSLESPDLGKFLDRMGYTGLVRRGRASMSGKVNWAGRPSMLDFATLNGTLAVQATDGQFAKIESGGGKLIGLLSLQALPRRFLLDFNDVFSEGFAFDKIEGSLIVNKGILRTQEPLVVEGAAAQILMQGDTDLAQEKQNLQITVRPRFGGVASLGAAVAVNPVVGIASLLAQKILQDPLDRILSYQYRVTGTWDEPQVVKE